MQIVRALSAVLFLFAFIGGPQSADVNAAEDAPRITKEEAKAVLGKPNAVFIDARTDSSWKGSDRKIKGAVRHDRFDPESIARDYPKDTTFIIY